MLDKLEKHGVKILVFVINIFLAAIAVFIIREKDQARLLEKAQSEKENSGSENTGKSVLQSFENSISAEDQSETISEGANPIQEIAPKAANQDPAPGTANTSSSPAAASSSTTKSQQTSGSTKNNSSSNTSKSSGSSSSSSSQKSSSGSSNAKTKSS